MSTSELIVLTIIFCFLPDARAYQYIFKGTPANTVIQSENYPLSYPRDCNVTWEWKVPSGQWGVVFKDFDLDSGSESTDYYDKLEIYDGRRRSVIYSTHVHPVLSYISEGPQLFVHFVSDGLSESDTRGFKLLILYGASEREVHIKIHEAIKPEKGSQEEGSSTFLIIIIAALAVIALVIILVVAILFRKNKHNKHGDNRNAFGVRRNSGISHSRRTRSESTDEAPADDQQMPQQQQHHQQHHQQQQQQQQRRIERPSVQRSNSQLNWMARAELTTTIQKTGCAPRPNHYTSTDVLNKTAACSSKIASPTFSRSATNSCSKGTLRGNNHTTSEYSETVDSLHHKHETTRDFSEGHLQEYEPPSYEESYAIQKSIQCTGENSPDSSNCYENCFSIACPSNLHQGKHTNIYINNGAASGSTCSINEITIDATKCVIKSKCYDNLEGAGSAGKPAGSVDSHETKMVIYQNAMMSSPKTNKTASVSSVQIIDGYAFIVPSYNHQDEFGQQTSPLDSGGQRTPTTMSTSKHNMLSSSEEASHIADCQNCIDTFNDAYVNLQEN